MITPEMKERAASILRSYGVDDVAYDLGHEILARCLPLSPSRLSANDEGVTDDYVRGMRRAAEIAMEENKRRLALASIRVPAMAVEIRDAILKEAATQPPTPASGGQMEGEDAVHELYLDALAEAEKAMRKFPQPNYVISKVAEEAGEVVKAAIHCAEGRETHAALVGEIRQAMAMLIRLYIEGDQVHGLSSPRAALETRHYQPGDVTGGTIPRLENCGRYLAEDNKGQWHYLNHANTWQGYQGPHPDAGKHEGVKIAPEDDYYRGDPRAERRTPTPASGEQMGVVEQIKGELLWAFKKWQHSHTAEELVQTILESPALSKALVTLTAANERAERAERRLEDYQDTHTDDEGNVWHRPTAWSYFAACRALDRAQSRAEISEALNTTLSEALERLENDGKEFLEAAEAVFDWMNGNDLSADHEEQKPDDFKRVSEALVAFRTALAALPAKQGEQS